MKKNTVYWQLTFAAAVILLITAGVRLSLGLLVKPINQTEGLAVADISLALAFTQLIWGVSQPLAGILAERIGARAVLLGGTLLSCAACLMAPYMVSKWGLVLSLGFLLAAGTGAGSYSILMGLIAQKVPAKMQGIASGIINAGSSFGQFLFAPIVSLLIVTGGIGWQGALWFLSAASLFALPLCVYLTKDAASTGRKGLAPLDPNLPLTEQRVGAAITAAVKNRSYLLLNIGFFTCGFHIAFLVTHLPVEVTLVAGLKENVAAWSLAIIGLSNVAGSLFFGWCTGRYQSRYILFWMYFSRAVLIAVYLFLPKTPLTFYTFAIGLGFTWLATVPPTAAACAKLFGVRFLATLFGLTLVSHQIGGFLGAWLGGRIYTASHDYTVMWYVDIALALAAAVLCLPIKERRAAGFLPEAAA